MKNIGRIDRERDLGFGAESNAEFAERSQSPDQLAIVSIVAGEIVVASPVVNGPQGSFPMDISRFPAQADFPVAINIQRVRDLGLPSLSRETHYLTTVSDHSERTRILALDGEKLAFDDDELLEWLINAEKQMFLGTDNYPVFETSLEDTACSISRLPNGRISMTEVPRQYIQAVGARVRSFLGENRTSPINLGIETPLRAAARYFLTLTNEGKETMHPGRRSEVTAFIIVNRSGHSFGLWSPQAGLFSEYAFLAPDEISRGTSGSDKVPASPRAAKAAADVDDRGPVESYIRQAFDQISLQMSEDKLESLQLSNYAQVVWATEKGLSAMATPIASEFAERTGLDLVSLGVPVDEAIAAGLLLGSYSFGEPRVAGAENLPSVDLAHDIMAMANTEEIQRHREEQTRQYERRNSAVMTVMAAPVIVAACLLALVAGLIASNMTTAIRESRADAMTLKLKPDLERRKSYEANLKWYQEFISEVSQLRRQQPVGIGLLYQLNGNYPFNIDPAFYVSDLKLTDKGDVEMKGLARNKDSVASFLKALEFAGGPESGTRLFSNLAYEVQEPVRDATAGQVKLPTMAGSTLGGTGVVASGVVRWNIKGNYVPVADFAPKPPPANQPGTPAAVPAKPAT